MRHSAARTLPAFALVLTVGIAVGGCTAASATDRSASAGSAASPAAPATGSAAARASKPAYGPPAPDPACVAALKAEQTLGTRQDKDQDNESALDQDFTNFANALSAAAQQETHPATAKTMTALATDYTDLVESQSGAAQLPDMTTVEADGTAFEKACSLKVARVGGWRRSRDHPTRPGPAAGAHVAGSEIPLNSCDIHPADSAEVRHCTEICPTFS
jgi:hypothetical protein